MIQQTISTQKQMSTKIVIAALQQMVILNAGNDSKVKDTIKLKFIQCCCVSTRAKSDNLINWLKYPKTNSNFLFQANFNTLSKHTQVNDVTLKIKCTKISS